MLLAVAALAAVLAVIFAIEAAGGGKAGTLLGPVVVAAVIALLCLRLAQTGVSADPATEAIVVHGLFGSTSIPFADVTEVHSGTEHMVGYRLVRITRENGATVRPIGLGILFPGPFGGSAGLRHDMDAACKELRTRIRLHRERLGLDRLPSRPA
jgi:hypothetical protein